MPVSAPLSRRRSGKTSCSWPTIFIARETGVSLDPDSLFDVQVKRIYEYKRQLLNVLHVIARYNALRSGATAGLAPRSVIFAGKAASSYHMAKQVIRLSRSSG